ncbi:MAG: hypothetical protein ACMG57_04020 [Candidatus Dojkabacteria bacterium]
MASLYVASNNARKGVVVVLGVAVAIILIDTFIKIRNQTILPPPSTRRFYLDADKALGDIKAPNIPGIQVDIKNVTVDSISPLAFPDVSYVYTIEEPREKSNTVENASLTAKNVGFTVVNLKQIGNNDYKWTTSDQSKTLNFNRLSQVWSFSTIYENNVDARKKKTMLPDINSYIAKVPTVLGSLLFSTGFGFTSPKIDARYIVRSDQGDITETQDSKVANYVKLNVYRKLALADLKPQADQPKLLTGEIKPQAVTGFVYKTDPRVGEFNAAVSNDLSNLSRDLFEMNFVNYTYGTKGIYQIITPDEALTKVINGQGSLVALAAEGTDYFEPYVKISVDNFIVDARKTELGFYEPDEWTGFAYPIYILNGRAKLTDGRLASFTFYVDAIKRQT